MLNEDVGWLRPSRVRRELDGCSTEHFPITIRPTSWSFLPHKVVRIDDIRRASPVERGTLLSLVFDLLVNNWSRVRFGPCIEGSVFELALEEAPKHFSYLDGYLTVSIGPRDSHFHLCLGPTRGLTGETPEELAAIRQCAKAEMVRVIGSDGRPRSWQVVLWNGAQEQMVTFFLPSPFRDDDMQKLRTPDPNRLALWNALRARYLGERIPEPFVVER